MFILVTGHPRSGTGYMALLLQSLGLDVGHEMPGKDGLSHWQFAVKSDQVLYRIRKGRNHFNFDFVIHVVRNPIKVVESVFYTENHEMKSINWREKYIPKLRSYRDRNDMLSHTIMSVIEWNELVEEVDLVMQVEEAEKEMPWIMKQTFTKSPPVRTVNARKHETLPDLSKHRLFSELQQHAKKYGYEI